MSRQVIWTKLILEQFIRQGNLNRQQQMIMRTRAAGWSRVKQSMEFGMSLSTVDKIISRLKRIYDQTQRFSVILPPRRQSAKQLYMDQSKIPQIINMDDSDDNDDHDVQQNIIT